MKGAIATHGHGVPAGLADPNLDVIGEALHRSPDVAAESVETDGFSCLSVVQVAGRQYEVLVRPRIRPAGDNFPDVGGRIRLYFGGEGHEDLDEIDRVVMGHRFPIDPQD